MRAGMRLTTTMRTRMRRSWGNTKGYSDTRMRAMRERKTSWEATMGALASMMPASPTHAPWMIPYSQELPKICHMLTTHGTDQ